MPTESRASFFSRHFFVRKNTFHPPIMLLTAGLKGEYTLLKFVFPAGYLQNLLTRKPMPLQ